MSTLLLLILLGVAIVIGVYAWNRNLTARAVPTALETDLRRAVNRPPISPAVPVYPPPTAPSMGVLQGNQVSRRGRYY